MPEMGDFMTLALRIEAGDEVYVDDAEGIVGHVRRANLRDVYVYIDEKGDFTLPRDTVKVARNGQIVLLCKKLPIGMRAVIGHLHGEDYEEDDN